MDDLNRLERTKLWSYQLTLRLWVLAGGLVLVNALIVPGSSFSQINFIFEVTSKVIGLLPGFAIMAATVATWIYIGCAYTLQRQETSHYWDKGARRYRKDNR